MYSTIGSNVNLTCDLNVERMYVLWLGPPNLATYAIGNETYEINDTIIRIIGNGQQKQHILQIVNMQDINEGLYKCTATEGENCFKVFTQKPPSNISIERSNKERIVFGIFNQQMNLTCDVETGKPPEMMRWEYENNTVTSGGPESLTYTFLSEYKHHLKTFMCIVFNNVTRTTLTAKVSLYLFFEPTVKMIPGGTINITEHDALLLECNYTSNDISNTSITWKSTSKGHFKHNVNKVLTIANITRSDEGQYTCLVSNSAGKSEDTVTVKVFYPPAVNITFEEKQSDRVFKCNAHGNPADYIFSEWEHRTEYGDHIRLLNDSGSGFIKLQNSSGETDRHHDQGIYTCRVSNGVLFNGNIIQSANFNFKPKGLPYFATSSHLIQYGIIGRETMLTFNVVSHQKIETVNVYKNDSVFIKDANFKTEYTKAEDIIYGSKVNVKGYKLFVPIEVGASEDFMMYTVSASNDCGQRNISIEIRSAIGGHGVENDIYDIQNNLAPAQVAQSNDPPVYSSIDRKHNLRIGQAVCYSVTKKKKPNSLGARYRHKGKQQEEAETDIEMSTSQAEDNDQLNYVDVCFEPKPVGHQFKIHGMDKKSEYVDIDFSKSIDVLPDNEKINETDEDFSGVEDIITMKKDMMF
ncbi:HMCN [Mytilus coruscus]|uniref:HMCN n=1 Tax=Mytilus coruscus TaxID=42192 RepID=A0A6J8EY30_MYTCO|nr:HMCN [Mytilus coruscus]